MKFLSKGAGSLFGNAQKERGSIFGPYLDTQRGHRLRRTLGGMGKDLLRQVPQMALQYAAGQFMAPSFKPDGGEFDMQPAPTRSPLPAPKGGGTWNAPRIAPFPEVRPVRAAPWRTRIMPWDEFLAPGRWRR